MATEAEEVRAGHAGGSSTAAWALTYAALGWRVFPVVPGGKRPLYVGWQRDATTEAGLIARHWRREPAPNIGIICGEAFDAFDIEAAHLPLLRSWTTMNGHALPQTPVARTGGGGIHILVQPVGLGRGCDLRLAGVHIGELKSAGGFIVVCPSVTSGIYRWLRSPAEVEIAPAHAWLGELLRGPGPNRGPGDGGRSRRGRSAQQGLSALAGAIARAGVGKRNKVLYWAIRRAEEEGTSAADAARKLGQAALAAGLTEREVGATIRSAHEASQQ